MQWFDKVCSKVDLYSSDREESNRYLYPPKLIHEIEHKLRQWMFIRLASKWEWLPRKKFMSKDKFNEKD